ncbi:MAG: hypothetical protein RR073_01585 [Clostridia bacterium]
MVTIKNIVRNGNIASCDFYPEDWETCGSIEVDLTSNEIINKVYPLNGCLERYPFYAKRELVRVVTSGKKIPEKSINMWY